MNHRSPLVLVLTGSLLLTCAPATAQMRREPRQPTPTRQPVPAPVAAPRYVPGQPPHDRVLAFEIGSATWDGGPQGGMVGLSWQERPVRPLTLGGIWTLRAQPGRSVTTLELDGRSKILDGYRDAWGAFLGLVVGLKVQVINQEGGAGPAVGLLTGLELQHQAMLTGRVTYAPVLTGGGTLRNVVDARIGLDLHPPGVPIMHLSLVGQQTEGPVRITVFGATMGLGMPY